MICRINIRINFVHQFPLTHNRNNYYVNSSQSCYHRTQQREKESVDNIDKDLTNQTKTLLQFITRVYFIEYRQRYGINTSTIRRRRWIRSNEFSFTSHLTFSPADAFQTPLNRIKNLFFYFYCFSSIQSFVSDHNCLVGLFLIVGKKKNWIIKENHWMK